VAWWPLAPVIAVIAAIAVTGGLIALVRAGDWDRGLSESVALRDPELVTAASIAGGRDLYRQHCSTCHGEHGRGNGPSAAGLDPPPADLVLHVPQHTEGELFYMITRGMPNSAMPAWGPVLSDRERWHLVHYLNELAAGVP
jgi:mono/diheme cytochrome c family protein